MSYIDPARAKAFEAALDMKRLGTNRHDVLEDARRIEAYLTGADQVPEVEQASDPRDENWWKAHQAAANPAVADDERSPAPSQYEEPLPRSMHGLIGEAGTPDDDPPPATKKERKPRKAKAAKATGKKRGRPSKADREAAAAAEPVANGAADAPHIPAAAEPSPTPDAIAA